MSCFIKNDENSNDKRLARMVVFGIIELIER